jgi:hypothetical protein
MDDSVRPGDLIRITKPLNFMGSPVLGAGVTALVISISSWTDVSHDRALLLLDDRLLDIPDWWLRNNCAVINT